MKSTRLIQRSFSIFFLLLFAQKIGFGLYLHNWFHTTRYQQSLPQTPAKNAASYSCNCIEDFSMPLAQPDFVIKSTVRVHDLVFFSLPISSFSFSSLSFNSLRAPPAITV